MKRKVGLNPKSTVICGESLLGVLHFPTAKDIEHFVITSLPSPIYQGRSDSFEIDTCEPQLKAMQQRKIELHALSKGHYPGERMNPDTLPGISSLGFWSCGEVQDWGLNSHRNEGLEIAFLETGEMGFEVDGQKHPLQAGNLTMTRPWQLHKLGNPNIGRGKLYWLILDVGVRRPNEDWIWPSWMVLSPQDLEDLTRKLRYGDQTIWMGNARICQVFHDLADCIVHWKKPGAISKLTVTVNRLLVELVDLLADQHIPTSSESITRRRTVALFLKDLAENPASIAEPWTLETMASQCGMGITSLAKYSRILVNTGPMAYLNACRLEHAATELKERPYQSITEVAFQMGFNSSQYFATQFKQRHGLTPKQYGKQDLPSRVGTSKTIDDRPPVF